MGFMGVEFRRLLLACGRRLDLLCSLLLFVCFFHQRLRSLLMAALLFLLLEGCLPVALAHCATDTSEYRFRSVFYVLCIFFVGCAFDWFFVPDSFD